MIPKIIHYCWLSGEDIPDKLINCMNSWKKYLPDYKFMLWDLNRFDIESSIWVKEAYQLRKFAFAADYIRLYAIYNYGGIYLDMDVEILKDFDNLLNQEYMLAYEKVGVGIEAGIMGASPKAEWVKDCLSYYDNKHFNQDGILQMRPLPQIMLDVLQTHIIKGTIKPYTPDYFTCKSYETGKISVTSNSYSIHHFAGSWLSNRELISKYVVTFLGRKNAHYLAVIMRKLHLLK